MTKKQYTTSDVTIAVLNYNGRKKLPDLFSSITLLKNPPAEVLMVDDGSTDKSPQWVQEKYPDVRVIELPTNTKMLNIVRNTALKEARTDLVLIVDNDVVLLEDCIEEALHGINTLPDAAVCMTRAVYDDRPDIIYQDGQILHYIGASPNINRENHIDETNTKPRISIGWGVQLINRELTKPYRWFNENYLMGWADDGEFNHKLNMAGLKCYHVPTSVVRHKRHSGSKRYLGTVSNRWRFILEMYQLKTIILIFPTLLFYEIALFAFLCSKKAPMDYFRGMMHFIEQLYSILEERKLIQKQREVPDRDLMGSGDIFVYSDDLSSPLLTTGYRCMNSILNGYWVLVKKMV